MTNAYDFTLHGLRGGDLPLKAYEGRPLLIVNTASKCGFTPQYAGLQEIFEEFGPQGLTVLGVPSNDFGQQEPGSSSEIAEFCQINYGVGFTMAAKVHVTGPEADPLFKWLAAQGGFLAKPRWNFFKYLIDRNGQLAEWYSPLTKPESSKLKQALARVLG